MTPNKSRMVVEIRAGEILDIGGEISIELVKKSGQQARLCIVASPDIKIERKAEQVVVTSMAT